MKNIIIVSAFAAASIFAGALPSQAASVIVTTDHGGPGYHRPYYGHHLPPRRVSHDCVTRTERVHSHGHVVIKKTQVCR
jgi:hypothetical protein